MKRLEFEPVAKDPLLDQLTAFLTLRIGRPVTTEEAAALLRQGSVFRNKVRYRDPGIAPPGLVLEVFWPDLPVQEFTLDPARVVWQDEHLLVVDKPAGVNTSPSPFSDTDCLTWGVQKLLGEGFAVHAVHRLDRDTQGLIFFAKHKEAERALHEMFRDRSVRKVYRAVTPAFTLPGGIPPHSVYRWHDSLDFRGKVRSAATTVLRAGTDAEDRFVWTVLPHTGRPHQIRRHFARYLVPLWGDRAYGSGTWGPGDELGLACIAYRCRHPVTGRPLEVFRTGTGGPVPPVPEPGPGPR